MMSNYAYPIAEPTAKERIQELFGFDGRIGRQTYWLRAVLLWAINLIAVALVALTPDSGAAAIPLVLLGGAIYLAVFLASLATTVKRLHDRGRSGWFMLIALIPLVGLWLVIEVGFLRGNDGANAYGDPVA